MFLRLRAGGPPASERLIRFTRCGVPSTCLAKPATVPVHGIREDSVLRPCSIPRSLRRFSRPSLNGHGLRSRASPLLSLKAVTHFRRVTQFRRGLSLVFLLVNFQTIKF